MERSMVAKELVRIAQLIDAAETYPCPECGTKVLENTGYCVKCQSKVKKASSRCAAETFPCPECGTKVLENTGYCVKCQSKVKKASSRCAMEFDTKEQLQKYLDDHPGADKSLHKVKKTTKKQPAKKDGTGGSGFFSPTQWGNLYGRLTVGESAGYGMSPSGVLRRALDAKTKIPKKGKREDGTILWDWNTKGSKGSVAVKPVLKKSGMDVHVRSIVNGVTEDETLSFNRKTAMRDVAAKVSAIVERKHPHGSQSQPSARS